MRSTRLPSWIERLVGLEPQPVPPHVFAIDERALRYASFERGRGTVRMASYLRCDLQPGVFQSGPLGGPVAQPERFRKSLAELLAELEEPAREGLQEASLVVPDRWLRLVFAELSDLPEAAAARDEVLRWKLRRLVPFRVEDLRVQGVEVPALERPTEPRRVLLGFAIEVLLAQLEEAFGAADIGIGQISNTSLSLAVSLHRMPQPALGTLLVVVQERDYSLLFARGGEPALYRYKSLGEQLDAEAVAALVGRELKLTASYLHEQLPASPIERVVLVASPLQQDAWLDYVSHALEIAPELLDAGHLELGDGSLPALAATDWAQAAAMHGAAAREVA